jgi:predicted metal-binding membrane protein
MLLPSATPMVRMFARSAEEQSGVAMYCRSRGAEERL